MPREVVHQDILVVQPVDGIVSAIVGILRSSGAVESVDVHFSIAPLVMHQDVLPSRCACKGFNVRRVPVFEFHAEVGSDRVAFVDAVCGVQATLARHSGGGADPKVEDPAARLHFEVNLAPQAMATMLDGGPKRWPGGSNAAPVAFVGHVKRCVVWVHEFKGVHVKEGDVPAVYYGYVDGVAWAELPTFEVCVEC